MPKKLYKYILYSYIKAIKMFYSYRFFRVTILFENKNFKSCAYIKYNNVMLLKTLRPELPGVLDALLTVYIENIFLTTKLIFNFYKM